jgi:hypothetical protein
MAYHRTKIKLLFITSDLSNFSGAAHNSYYLTKELQKITELMLWQKPGCINEIIAQLKRRPDFILLNDIKERPEISGLTSLDIPFGIIMHDLHYKTEGRKRFITENNVKYIFSIYRDKFYDWYPQFKARMRWLPHYVNTQTYKDYRLPKEIDWLMMGAVATWSYPLRVKILHVMKEKKGFVYHPHPGYRNIKENESVYVGETYAREINKAKIFLTCNSIFKYTLSKYFEVLACRTLLLAPDSKELYDLGFIPGVHYVPINEHDFLEKAEYYLADEQERRRITDQGYDMVHREYSVSKRTALLVSMIDDILNRS